MENITSVINALPQSSALELPVSSIIPEWFSIAFASINGAGFCLNTLSLWLLATRKFVYKYKVNIFIVSLCLSDFLVSLSSFYFLGTITSENISHFSKRVATIIFSFALETSLMSLCCLSYERLTAVRKPFHYMEILSTKKVIVIIVFGWSFCIALLAMQFVFGFVYRHKKYVYFNWIVFISLAIVSITFLAVVYIYLVYEIHRHSTHMKSCSISSKLPFLPESSSDIVKDQADNLTEVTFASGTTETNLLKKKRPSIETYNSRLYTPRTSVSTNSTRSQSPSISKTRSDSVDLLKQALENTRNSSRLSQTRRRTTARGLLIRKERNSVLLCLCIVLVFAGSWLPVIAFFTRCLIANTCETDDRLLYICSCLVSFNSLLDPIIYFIIKKEFKEFLFGKICGQQSRRRNSSSYRRSSGDVL